MKQILISTFIVTMLAISVGCAQKQPAEDQKIKHISAKQVKQLLTSDADIVLLDVRTEMEYNGPMGRIEGSILIPVQELTARSAELLPYKGKRIIIYCRSGNRSQTAARILMAQGYKVENMLGGMIDWNRL